jgi:autotransporter-associated beta strand protein
MKPKSQFLRSSFLPTHIALSLGLAIAGLSPHSAQAANQAWSTTAPGPADGNFSGTNWTVGTTGVATPTNAAATGDGLYFDTSAITTLADDLTGATFAGFTFNAGSSAYSIGGNSFTLSGALTNNGSNVQSFSNAITLAAAQSITGAGSLSLGGNLSGAGTSLTKSGTGTLSLSGTTNAITGNMILSAGRLNVTAGTTNFAGGFSNLANTASTTAIASTSSGATLGWTGANGGNFGGAAGASGVLYNAGTFNQSATTLNNAGIYLGNSASSYGYLLNSGTATTTLGGRLWIAQASAAAGATGVLDIKGGTVSVNPTGNFTAGQRLEINDDGNSHATSTSYAGVNVVNGTLTVGGTAQTNVNTGQNEYTSINITGTGKFTAGTAGTDAGIGLSVTSIATNTATLAVANGGTLETSYIYNNNALGTGIISIDNGTIRSIYNNSTGIIQGSNTKTYIQSGGATFDTNGYNTIVSNALLAPSGSGVNGITLGGTATGYVGAPVVKISGGGGTGAAAVANFDPSTGTVTGITVTSAGSGYTSTPTVTLVGGNGGSTGAGSGTATATASIAAVTSGGVTKTGTGTLTLTAANTYTGGTTINAGTLTYGVANALADTGAINVNGGTFNLATFGDTVGAVTLTSGTISGSTGVLTGSSYGVQSGAISGILGGSGGLAKSTGGTVTVSGVQAYTGATTVNGGNLTLSGTGSINSSSGITINGSGAKFVQTSSTAVSPNITLTQGTLDGTTTVGAVTVGAGTGGVVANGNGTTGKLTLGSLAFSGGGTVNLNLLGGASNTTEGLDVTGAIQTSGTAGSIAVNVSPTSPLNLDTTYNLIKYGSYSSGTVADFIFGGNSSRKTGTFANDTTNNYITLTVSGDTPKWTGADDGNWVVGTTGANHNWQLVTAGTPTDYIEGDDVSFSDTASSKAVNISAANVSPASTTFNNSTGNDYTVSSTGGYGIAGTGPLVKSGTGKVTITTVNSFTGVTTINNGTLQIGDGTTDGSIASSSGIADNGALIYNLVGARTYANVISGAGSLTKSGAGTLTLWHDHDQ